MKRPFKPHTLAEIQRATYHANMRVKEVLDWANAITTDVKKEQRLEKHMCKACFYGPPRMGGAAMTTRNCGCCESEQTYGSTNTDVLCLPCAIANKLCKHCGGDIDMTERH